MPALKNKFQDVRGQLVSSFSLASQSFLFSDHSGDEALGQKFSYTELVPIVLSQTYMHKDDGFCTHMVRSPCVLNIEEKNFMKEKQRV